MKIGRFLVFHFLTDITYSSTTCNPFQWSLPLALSNVGHTLNITFCSSQNFLTFGVSLSLNNLYYCVVAFI